MVSLIFFRFVENVIRSKQRNNPWFQLGKLAILGVCLPVNPWVFQCSLSPCDLSGSWCVPQAGSARHGAVLGEEFSTTSDSVPSSRQQLCPFRGVGMVWCPAPLAFFCVCSDSPWSWVRGQEPFTSLRTPC